MLAPEVCLDRAKGSSPARLRGVGEEGEALQAGPAPRSPSDAQAEHGPAAPHLVHPLGPGRWAPLPPATEGCAQLSPLPQPTQSGDGGLALRPRTHQVADGLGQRLPRGCALLTLLCFQKWPRGRGAAAQPDPPQHTHIPGKVVSRGFGSVQSQSMLTPGTWALGQHCPRSAIPPSSGPVCAPGHSLRRPPASPARDLPQLTPQVNFLTSAGRAPGDPRPRVWQAVSMSLCVGAQIHHVFTHTDTPHRIWSPHHPAFHKWESGLSRASVSVSLCVSLHLPPCPSLNLEVFTWGVGLQSLGITLL